ncbi:MAG: hypothetical protein LC637_03525 [Xanthomonadaceae bacterium]|nr:hypothetical protein [Xanthomonadaceae bacterium]
MKLPEIESLVRPSSPSSCNHARGDCPSAEQLSALATDRVWPWQRRRLVVHLGRCQSCAADFQVLARLQHSLEATLEGTCAAAPVRRPLAPFITGLAGTAALVVMAFGVAVWIDFSPNGPGAAAGSDVLFASRFEPAGDDTGKPDDTLFKSDFGGPRTEPQVFVDSFGG